MEISLDELEIIKEKAFKSGYNKGYKYGHEVGYAQGIDYSDNALEERIVDLEEDLELVKQNMIKEFVTYAKTAFGVDLTIKPAGGGSDSFESLFGNIGE